LIIFSLIVGGVSASDEGLVAYWSFDDETANDEARKIFCSNQNHREI